MARIWKQAWDLEMLREFHKDTMQEYLGLEFLEIGDDFLMGRMPVDHRTRQPMGLFHGGASVTLAESLGSLAALMAVDAARYEVVGLEINANHIRITTSGFVYGVARPLHIGRSTQVWEIRMTNEAGQLTCISRITNMVKEKNSRQQDVEISS